MTPSQMYRWLAVFSVWQVAGGAPTVITVTDINIIEVTGTIPPFVDVTFPEETNFTIPDFPEFNFTDGSGVTIDFSGVTPQEGSGFTIPEGSGSGNVSDVDCNSISNFISVDSSSKSSILIDLLNSAYALWDKTMQGNFLPYKNRIDTIILSNEFLCAADKLEEINSVLANWAPDGSEEKEVVFTIKITGWGTLKQMLTCIEDLEIGGENAGGFTLPPCETSGFTLPELNFTVVMPTLESSGSGNEGSGSGSEGSGSGSEGSGSGSEGSGSGGSDIDCKDVLEFIDIDPVTNSSKLTDALNEAYASWSRGMKGNFIAYKKRIESVIFSDEFLCASDKLEEIGLVLSNWAPDDSEDQKVVYSIKIEGWSGTLKDFVKCVSEGEGGGSDGGFTLPPCESSSGSGSEGSGSEGSGSGSEGSGSEGSGSEGSGSGSDIDCSAIMEFIQVDPATNTSKLTTAIGDAFLTWGRTMKSNFASYKKRIETIIFTDEFPCDSDKLEMIGLVLSNWAPEGSADQETVYSLKIEGWSGTLKDLVKCIDEGSTGGSDGGFTLPPCDSSSGSGSEGSGSEGSGSEGSGSEGSGSGLDIDCSAVLTFIEIDSSSNSTELTDVLNDAYATWPRGMKGNFLSYKKRMEGIIWGGEFVCAADKLEEIALVLSNWAPEGSSDQEVVYSLTFSGWSGTIKDFVKCIEDGSAGGSEGGFTLPPCETSSVTPPEDGSGSGSEGSGSGMIKGDCNMITSFIEIDSVSNSTVLTTSINKVYNTWGRNDKSGFLSYKNLIENIIWSDEISCESEKIERIVQALSRAYPEGTVQQKAIYAIEIEGWGSVGDFISCVQSGSSSIEASSSGSGSGGGSFSLAPCVTEGTTEVPTTPIVEVTTEAPTTLPSGPDCSVTGSLIEVDTVTNKTVLTTAINDFYLNNMTRTDKANFSSYKKRIETIIYGTEFTTTTEKLDNVVQVLDNYSPEGSAQQVQVESIMIGSWGTVKQFIACVQGA